MIVWDTETTGLIKPLITPLDQQPYICEVCMVKVDPKSFKVKEVFNELIKPPIPIPPETTKIHGISNEDVKNAPSFARLLPKLAAFVLGEERIIAHNNAFDIGMLELELRRVGKVTAFPWPPNQICSVEATFGLKGHRLNLSALHTLATGKEHKDGAHRARPDVDALIRCLPFLSKKGLIA